MTSRPTDAALPFDHADRMARARLSLTGLSVGDAFGERFFSAQAQWLISSRALPKEPWHYTDDTTMALSIVETLDERGRIDCDDLAQRFAQRYRDDPGRGYGGMAHRILTEFGSGVPWQQAAGKAFGGEGSMGNGGAMRVGPGTGAPRPMTARRRAFGRTAGDAPFEGSRSPKCGFLAQGLRAEKGRTAATYDLNSPPSRW